MKQRKEEILNNLSLFYTTFPSEGEAKEVVLPLLKEKLLVCANFFPITSLYIWEEKIEHSSEVGCYLKTLHLKKEIFRQKFLEKHPYDIPCLIEITLKEVHKPYLNWANAIIL